jgi:UDP-2,3-diacylglucosamine pyrophosphatase LpxH
MEFVNIRIFFLFLIPFLFISCIGDADLTGFIRSTDRIEDRFALSMEYNTGKERMIQVYNEVYDLIVGADIHIGDTVNYNLLLNDALSPEIAAMVLVGDIVTGKEKDYKLLKSILPADNQKQAFLLTGNHELYFDGWKHFSKFFGSSVYYFSVITPENRDLYICLDSGSGTLGKSQMKWLRNLLENSRKDYRYCVVFTHNNLFRNRFTVSTNPPENEVIVLMDLFLEHNVDMVVMGHDHIRAINLFGNTTYVTLDALADYHFNASYMKIRAAGSGLNYHFVEVKRGSN